MSGRGDSDAKRDDRADRLAEALRQNLRRRKAQARSRRGPSGGGSEAGDGPQATDAPDRNGRGQGEAAEDGPRE